jgi:hypothetical protein
VIDASTYDVRALGSAAVLDRAADLLAEGVAIALGLRDSLTIELRLPAELTGHERALLNAVDVIRSLANIQAGQRKIDIQRHCRPSCWAEAPTCGGWCHAETRAASRCCRRRFQHRRRC